MSNQTIAQIPYDVSDTISLKRFLSQLVDNLDIVLGYKGSDEGYVSTKEQADTIQSITTDITSLLNKTQLSSEDIAQLKDSLEELVFAVERQNVTESSSTLSVDYNDFDAAAWSTLKGAFYLSADGADLSNTPFTATSGTVYDVYIRSTDVGSDAHQQISVGKDTVEVYVRWGVGNDWTQLG